MCLVLSKKGQLEELEEMEWKVGQIRKILGAKQNGKERSNKEMEGIRRTCVCRMKNLQIQWGNEGSNCMDSFFEWNQNG